MGKSLAVHWRDATEPFSAATTSYVSPGGSSIENDPTVVSTERPLRLAGTARNLFVTVANNGITLDSTVELLDEGVGTGLIATVSNAASGDFEDSANEAILAATDEITLEFVQGATGTSYDLVLASFEFDSTADMVTLLGCNATSSLALGSAVTTYVPVMGGRSAEATEANRQYRIGEGNVTWQDASLRTATNSLNGATEVRSRIDAVDGNMLITVNASTGNETLEDSANSDSIAADQDICWEIATAGTSGTINFEKFYGNLVSTDSQWFTCVHGNNARTNDNQTGYWPIRGEVSDEGDTEDNTDVTARFSFTSEELIAHINRMTGTVAVDYIFRINGVDGNQLVEPALDVITTDTANTDLVAAGDDINFKVTSPVGGTNFDTQYIGMIGLVAAAAATKRLLLINPPGLDGGMGLSI